ncbi:MAG: ABC transporter ATP-binding protein [Thermoanaerobaculia bacterium]
MSLWRSLAHLGTFSDRRLVPLLSVLVVTGALYMGAQVSLPVITGSIVDDALLAGDRGALAIRVILLVGVALASTLAKGVHETTTTWLSERGRARLQAGLLERLYLRPLAFFDRERSGRLHSLLVKDAAEATRSAGTMVSELVLGFLQLVLILAVLFSGYGGIAFAALVLIPIYMVFPLYIARPARQAARESLAAHAEVNSALQESIQSVREVKVFGRRQWVLERVRVLLDTDVARSLRLTILRSAYSFQYAVFFLVAGAVYWAGGTQVFAGRLSVGELVALVALMSQLEGPVSRLTKLTHEFQRISAAVDRIDEAVTSETEPPDDRGVELLPGSHRVEMRDVVFHYDEQDRPAVEGVSFELAPGRRVALVGPSGAGKSTLVALLARLYEPRSGTIAIDGVPITDYTLASLRREIGFVLQDSMLFAGTVRQNIRIGRLDATDQEIEESARQANAHSFIAALEQGYDTEIGERGVRLSGGQRQRIGIARVLLRDPGILVLDEAMSALDTETERLVQEALRRLMEGRTTIVVAHRPSTFSEADHIVVLDRGRVVATGTHDHLEATCAVYHRLLTGTADDEPERRLRPTEALA